MHARKIVIPRDRKPSPVAMTAHARRVQKALEEAHRLDRDLIEACKDLALNDPDALKAVDVK